MQASRNYKDLRFGASSKRQVESDAKRVRAKAGYDVLPISTAYFHFIRAHITLISLLLCYKRIC